MSGNSLLRTAIALSVGLLAAISLAACSGSDVGPQSRAFDLAIEEGAVELAGGVISVTQGDQVTLNFNADEKGLIHLHGYDIEQEVGPGEPTTFDFVADATGMYIFTFHGGGGSHNDEGVHSALFESGLLEAGDTFEFEVPHDMQETLIPFHNHVTHDVIGHIAVEEGAAGSDVVSIRVFSDGSFSPEEVVVGPETTVVFINEGPDRALIASGNPSATDDDDHEEHDDDEEETVLGALEVRPR